jgi:hypothetical protein
MTSSFDSIPSIVYYLAVQRDQVRRTRHLSQQGVVLLVIIIAGTSIYLGFKTNAPPDIIFSPAVYKICGGSGMMVDPSDHPQRYVVFLADQSSITGLR